MADTRKDGKRGGAHRMRGLEWGSKRGPRGWKDAGSWTKRITHRMERRSGRSAIGRFLERVRDGFDLSRRAFDNCEGCYARPAVRWTDDDAYLCQKCYDELPQSPAAP